MLNAVKLSKTYDGGKRPVHVLVEVDLTVEEGEFVAVMGPSGSGKSTLLHLLGGLDSPSSGAILQYLPFVEDDDFWGVQNYTRSIIGPEGIQQTEGTRKTQMGYEFYPEALENVIRKVAEKFTKDIIVTENGIATSDDAYALNLSKKLFQG